MKLLFVDACPRGRGVSRTLRLGDAFMDAFVRAYPQVECLRHGVAAMGLLPMDGQSLAARESLIDARAWDAPVFAPARDFVQADAIVIAAPYWDLMFPAMLKVYIEHIFIREMTFCYRDDRPIGLCKGRRALFLTTAGSPIEKGQHFGEDYLRETLKMLGIPRFDCIAAKGLDIQGANVQGILQSAWEHAETCARIFMSDDE